MRKSLSKKFLTMAVLTAVAGGAFCAPASAHELTSFNLDEILVEESAVALPGGFLDSNSRVGVFGDMDIVDVPFTQNRYTIKTIESFEDPNRPLNGVISNNPSVTVRSCTTMYTDFSIRGLNMNGNHFVLNGIPSLFNQSIGVPMYAVDSIDLVSGPNTVLNGGSNSTNGTNGKGASPGVLSATTKKAAAEPMNRYKQVFSGRKNMTEQVEIGRRFGDNDEWGVRVMGRRQAGNTAIKNTETHEKSAYVNIDRKGDKSVTNIFAGYFDAGTIGGQRWLRGDKLTEMPEAPKLNTNISFDGQEKNYNGYVVTFNHEMKLGDDWALFLNAGGNKYQEEKVDPWTGSYYLLDGGIIKTHKNGMRRYKSHIRSIYAQAGVRGEFMLGDVKNHLVVSADHEHYNSYSAMVKGGQVIGNIYDGVISQGALPGPVDVFGSNRHIREDINSLTIADHMELGKWNAFAAAQYRKTDYFSQSKNEDISKSFWNPTYALSYKPEENMAIYASRAEGYTRPLLVKGDYLNAGEIFEPLCNTQNEFGIKYKTGKFLNTLAYFDLTEGNEEKKDVEGGTILTRDGKKCYKGVEWLFTGELSPKWSVLGGVTYIDPKFDSGSNNGKRSIGTPKWSGVIGAEYKPQEDTSLIGRVHYTGEMKVNHNNVMAPAFTTVDFGIRHMTHIDEVPVTLGLMCSNVFDKKYFTCDELGDPRTFMLSAQFDM